MRGLLCCLFTVAALSAQTPAKPISFDVASIKPAPDIMSLAQQLQSGKAHVGRKIDGHRLDFGFASLRDLICYAYDIQPHQLTGPDWLASERFDVLATIPEGASQDQVPAMMQSLLADRFGLRFHREDKEHPVYALIVAKGGPKMKESPPDAPAPAAAPAAGDTKSDPKAGMTIDTGRGPMNIKQDGKGGATIDAGPLGKARVSMSPDGLMHIDMEKVTMSALATQLTQFMDRPVLDMTNLQGNYQVAIDIPTSALLNMIRKQGINLPMMPGAGGAGPGAGPADAAADPVAEDAVFRSMEKMGLKLDPSKHSYGDIVVDHIEKTPTEN